MPYASLQPMPAGLRDPSPRRQRTRHQLLDAIREHRGITRAELSRLTGLSRSATAEAVHDLLAHDLIVERRVEATGSRGRPSMLVFAKASEGFVGAVDFGHSHVLAAVADTNGRILAHHFQSADVDRQATDSLDAAADLLARCLKEAGLSAPDLASVAAGIPCPLDANTGLVRSPAILAAWVDLEPASELAERIGRPVYVDNDANMGARGEQHFGAARGCRHFIYVKASHGIGTGLVLDGEIYRGRLGIAGEIGHTRLPEATNLCRCGNRGCLETVVSIIEVRRQLASIQSRPSSDAFEASLAAASSDPIAARVITSAGRTLGRVLADMCNTLNPDAIIVGGELSTAGEPLLAGIRESITQYAQPAAAEAVRVRVGELGLRAELLGAIATALTHVPHAATS
jgi:predicted NBD/HSP70 family sugar kinase